jgi:hypothetical protein
MFEVIQINGKMDSHGNDIFTPRCSLSRKVFESFGKCKVNLDELRTLQNEYKMNCSIYWI